MILYETLFSKIDYYVIIAIYDSEIMSVAHVQLPFNEQK